MTVTAEAPQVYVPEQMEQQPDTPEVPPVVAHVEDLALDGAASAVQMSLMTRY